MAEDPKSPRGTMRMGTAIGRPPGDLEWPGAEDATSFVPAVAKRTAAMPQVTETTKTNVWVATHQVPSDLDERLILVGDPDSQGAAAYRVLRQRMAERGDPRVICVTSPGKKEGKTTVAANLALALGECGRAKVLLVDANFRAPAIAAIFGFVPPECFSKQLERHRDKPQDPWSVVEVYNEFLHVVAIDPHLSSRPLVDAPAFSHAMTAFRHAGYDFIVVDTPAVLGQADVNLIEDTCDAVLLTGVSGFASARRVQRAIDQLSPAKILGITLIDT